MSAGGAAGGRSAAPEGRSALPRDRSPQRGEVILQIGEEYFADMDNTDVQANRPGSGALHFVRPRDRDRDREDGAGSSSLTSWWNRSVTNIRTVVFDGDVTLTNSRSAPEILAAGDARPALRPPAETNSRESNLPESDDGVVRIDVDEENADGERHEDDDERPGERRGENSFIDRGVIRMPLKESMRNLSFLLILLMKFVYDHLQGLVVFLSLYAIFYRVNRETGSRIAFRTNVSAKRALLATFATGGCIFFILFVSDYAKDYSRTLIFFPPTGERLTLYRLFWIVCMSDVLIKFGTVGIKILVACQPSGMMTFSRRAKTYSLVEQTSQLYRSLVPVPPWMFYLLNAYDGYRRLYGVFLCILYLFAKVEYLYRKVTLFAKCARDFLSGEDICAPSNAELLRNDDGLCSICHDEFRSPVTMVCSHVFCDSCISRWLNKSKTCPLCRTPIMKDIHWKSGYTSPYVQLW